MALSPFGERLGPGYIDKLLDSVLPPWFLKLLDLFPQGLSPTQGAGNYFPRVSGLPPSRNIFPVFSSGAELSLLLVLGLLS